MFLKDEIIYKMKKIKHKFIERKSESVNTIAFRIDYNGNKYGHYWEYEDKCDRYIKMRDLVERKKALINDLIYIENNKQCF